MKSRMFIEKPGEVQVTLTVTMSADRWDNIRNWLRESKAPLYEPPHQFASAIDDLLRQVRKMLWHDADDQKAGADG